ncbi:hypothetical protein D3C71_1229560 [compost metagenome]
MGVFTYWMAAWCCASTSGATLASASTVTVAPAAFLFWMLRSSDLLADLLTTHLVPSHCSASCTTPKALPQELAITAGTPLMVPALWSTPGSLKPGMAAVSGNTPCWWPITIASMPATFDRYRPGFSMVGEYAAPSSPPCRRATTRSAPLARSSGTYLLAASTAPSVVTLPSR